MKLNLKKNKIKNIKTNDFYRLRPAAVHKSIFKQRHPTTGPQKHFSIFSLSIFR